MTTQTGVVVAVMLAGFLTGVVKAIRFQRKMARNPPGWLWFSLDPKNERVARLGLTDRDPSEFLPAGIVLLYKQPVASQRVALLDVAACLSRAKVKGNWYKASAVRAYVRKLKRESEA